MSSSWQTQRHQMHPGRGAQGAAFYEVKKAEAELISSLYQCVLSLPEIRGPRGKTKKMEVLICLHM